MEKGKSERITAQLVAGKDLLNADLRCVDLEGIRFSNLSLRGSDLSYANLRGASLSSVELSRAKLVGADLRGATLENVSGSEADFTGTFFRGAKFIRGFFARAKFVDADLVNTTFEDTNMQFANFSGAYIRGLKFQGADVSGATGMEIDKPDTKKTYGFIGAVGGLFLVLALIAIALTWGKIQSGDDNMMDRADLIGNFMLNHVLDMGPEDQTNDEALASKTTVVESFIQTIPNLKYIAVYNREGHLMFDAGSKPPLTTEENARKKKMLSMAVSSGEPKKNKTLGCLALPIIESSGFLLYVAEASFSLDSAAAGSTGGSIKFAAFLISAALILSVISGFAVFRFHHWPLVSASREIDNIQGSIIDAFWHDKPKRVRDTHGPITGEVLDPAAIKEMITTVDTALIRLGEMGVESQTDSTRQEQLDDIIRMQKKVSRSNEKVKEANFRLKQRNDQFAFIAKRKDELFKIMRKYPRAVPPVIKWLFKQLKEGNLGDLTPEQARLIVDIEGHNIGGPPQYDPIADETLEKETVDIVEMAMKIHSTIARLAHEKKITLEFDHDAEKIAVVLDQRKIKRVIVSLISNAIKYTNPKGTVTLSVRDVPQMKSVLVAVRDTGTGLPDNRLKAMLNFPRKKNKASQKDGKSTGLDLFVCKKIVEGHEGQMKAQSTVGEGSIFSFLLPYGTSES